MSVRDCTSTALVNVNGFSLFTLYRKAGSVQVTNFLKRTYLDPKEVTAPLTDADAQAASAWKIVYLQRLQREITDPSCINAYLKAWNLSPDILSSGNPKHP